MGLSVRLYGPTVTFGLYPTDGRRMTVSSSFPLTKPILHASKPLMSTDEFLSLFSARDAHEPRDPMKAAQGSMRQALPKRFYAHAATEMRHGKVGAEWHLLLDGRGARTPARHPLTAENETIAQALAAEWAAQVDVIDPAAMPLTRLLNAAIDGVATQIDAVSKEIVSYAASDLICYRADTPQELVEQQLAIWDPLIAWASDRLNADLKVGAGVIHVAQSEEALVQVAEAVAATPAPCALAALNCMTTLTGSAIIALALAHGRLDADEAWIAAHVDEDYQAKVWGHDDEAVFRHINRRRDFDAAALVLASMRPNRMQGN